MRSFHDMEDVYDVYDDDGNDDDDDSNPYGVQLSPAAWRVRGHGTYEEVVTADVAGSFLELAKLHEKLVVHFCRENVSECEIMHNHLGTIAKQHLETKFVYLDVEKASARAKDMLVIECKLGVVAVPTLILVKNQQYAYRLKGLGELGGRDTSTFSIKQFLAVHGVLKLSEAEEARKMFEAESIQNDGQHHSSSFNLATPGVACGSAPLGASVGTAAEQKPVGWGPIPSFDFQLAERQNDTEFPESPGGIGPYRQWGPTSSIDESTLSGRKKTAPFDSCKLPAAAFAALGAFVGATFTACSTACAVFVGATVTTCSKIVPGKVVEERDGESKKVMRNSPSPMLGDERAKRLSFASMTSASISFLASLPCWVISTSIALTVVLALMLSEVTSFKYEKTIQVAFIGNSVQYFNDFPRFMEAISGGHVIQNSCLHEDASFYTLLQSGNGMLKKFNTEAARIDDSSSGFFDYGACTVHQLFFGYDGFLYGDWKSYNVSTVSDTYSGAYNDGLNPCYADTDYLTYVTKQFLQSNSMKWDYVVMNDDLLTPGSSESRQKSVAILMSTYASWFAQMGATPVFLDTPAYWTTFQNLSMFVNVPTFTSMTYEGYRQYAGLLGSLLPAAQKPLIAPVGIAFLAVWEDDYQMWTKLFHYDEINVSPHGTFLQGCVVHHTLFGHLPRGDIALPDSISSLFSRARRMQPPSHRRKEWPTRDEAVYLYNIAKKVVLGYLPTTFVKFKTR